MKNTTNCNQCTHMCDSKVCTHKGEPCSYLHKQYGMKTWVFKLIVIVIFLGVIVPFASEVICSLWFPDVTMGLSTWNQFVSIILGIVATLLSIVSMIMGFKNYEDALAIQEKYTKSQSDIGEIKRAVTSLSNSQYKQPPPPPDDSWSKDPKTIV